MKMLVRNNTEKTWTEVESVSYDGESDLQTLLASTPTLVPVDEIGEGISPFVFGVREYGLPGSGNTDILLFNPDGEIGIVECKLASNADIKRKVIGQILEYAAYLWNSRYDDVDSRVRTIAKQTLSEGVSKRVDAQNWEEEAFREGVAQSLTDGSFHLIVAVDNVNDELRKVIDYLNECGSTAFSLHALELQKYRSKETEMLVPHLFGKVPQRKQSTSKRRLWTEEGFFDQAKRDLSRNVLQLVTDLYIWSKETADNLYFGKGNQNASFTFHYKENGKTVSVFTVYANGRLVLNYEYLSKQIDPERLKGFDVRLRQKEPFAGLPRKATGFSSVELVALAEAGDESVRWFKDAVENVRQLSAP